MSKSTIITGVIMLSIGLAGGYWLSLDTGVRTAESEKEEVKPLYYRNPMNPGVTSPIPAKDSMGMDYIPVFADKGESQSERKVLFYRNPMNPSVTSPKPAKDSMGMDYVPVYEDGPSNDVVGTVTIDPSVVQNIGVRTSVASLEAMSRTVRTVGRIDFDEEKMSRLHPKVPGWIEEMRIDKTGEPVAEDDILLSIYSPKLVSTQQEYLLALNNLSALGDSTFQEILQGAKDLVKSSRERLELFDVPEHQILELEKTHEIKKKIHIHSPVNGTVLRIGARPGQYVTPQTELYMFADLKKVWVLADIYENEIPWVKVGDKVEMTLASVPGRTFTGELSYIYPYAEAKTRTTKVRIVVDNADLLLRPDMFAEITILSDTRDNAIVVPAQAVVRSGGKPQIFVVREPGKFEPRAVILGIESAGRVEVISGVSEGEEVVTSAQFLVDSESKLREATAKMMSVLGAPDSSSDSMPAAAAKKDDGAHNDHMIMDDHSGTDGSIQMKELQGGGPRHD